MTAAQVKKLMDVTHAIDLMHTMIRQGIEQQKKAAPFMPDAFWSDFETEIEKVDWIALATPAYQRHFSEDDADKLIAFYQTDLGQRTLKVTPLVMQEVSAKGVQIGQDIGQRLAQKYMDQIQQNIKSGGTAAAPK